MPEHHIGHRSERDGDEEGVGQATLPEPEEQEDHHGGGLGVAQLADQREEVQPEWVVAEEPLHGDDRCRIVQQPEQSLQGLRDRAQRADHDGFHTPLPELRETRRQPRLVSTSVPDWLTQSTVTAAYGAGGRGSIRPRAGTLGGFFAISRRAGPPRRSTARTHPGRTLAWCRRPGLRAPGRAGLLGDRIPFLAIQYFLFAAGSCRDAAWARVLPRKPIASAHLGIAVPEPRALRAPCAGPPYSQSPAQLPPQGECQPTRPTATLCAVRSNPTSDTKQAKGAAMLWRRTPWGQMTTGRKAGMVAQGTVQIALLGAALFDIHRRPAGRSRATRSSGPVWPS